MKASKSEMRLPNKIIRFHIVIRRLSVDVYSSIFLNEEIIYQFSWLHLMRKIDRMGTSESEPNPELRQNYEEIKIDIDDFRLS